MSERKSNADVASRRHLLKLGAMAAPAVITLAPASARAATSVLCHVPFPERGVDEEGLPCDSTTSGSDSNPRGGPGGTPPGHGGTPPGHGGTPPGQVRNPGSDDSPVTKVCHTPEGGILTSEQITNDFGIEGIGGGDMDSYNAYVNYLDRVKAENLQGASCLMSLDYTPRSGGQS